ncbi:type II toxin-antitoxin system Phd/YefM family antitoxin [Verminephrobacter aporrectodeae]|uniref:Type II toxin-antitoxin system Phd/YefM family antitoxin n=1 Tax=Verminephrobacter aporrectodeae subsp. tuberculatae TaxID=1110392 RepID=A0ABT3KTY0_9BURK|nr:type II toxin-antitoxin system Phd/YefM family antitoxin [Verminephrobacter aporrectodeae]MCW5222777.1 type II toxin-antitoxin system Phd/YefM family antitoxin [Verminephrobacter aporrectodeae subsp. tuberculatae]MCW5256995.1 type II toxin-antitoxin system Phd/YefM family antitoxin [Verminephrobacter aporrectodeae subsp. tuberculatae]MCW5288241.1 type II toxin-antitoxin system Phd/YefM family antitoxin [Verminephrobacter aporrectodeae subsp. tuberculatae]MCW5321794.1 type II toxin-antitoxin 
MTITTVSSRDFARDLATAKKATSAGPVFITDRGRPALALLRIEDYYRLAGEKPRTLLDAMDAIACPPGIDFPAERVRDWPRETELG